MCDWFGASYCGGSSCSNGCYCCTDSCSGGCGDNCGNGCGDGCTGACGNGGCTAKCANNCTGGCDTTCSGDCDGSCTGCRGCTGCSGDCDGSCTGCKGCTGTCKDQCDKGCSTESFIDLYNKLNLSTVIFKEEIDNLILALINELKRRDIKNQSSTVENLVILKEMYTNMNTDLDNLEYSNIEDTNLIKEAFYKDAINFIKELYNEKITDI